MTPIYPFNKFSVYLTSHFFSLYILNSYTICHFGTIQSSVIGYFSIEFVLVVPPQLIALPPSFVKGRRYPLTPQSRKPQSRFVA